MTESALSASFEYLCHGSTTTINILLFYCGDRIYTSKVDLRANCGHLAHVDWQSISLQICTLLTPQAPEEFFNGIAVDSE